MRRVVFIVRGWIGGLIAARLRQVQINLRCARLAGTFNAFVNHAHRVIKQEQNRLQQMDDDRGCRQLTARIDSLANPLIDLVELIRGNQYTDRDLTPLYDLCELLEEFGGEKAIIQRQDDFCTLAELFDDLVEQLLAPLSLRAL